MRLLGLHLVFLGGFGVAMVGQLAGTPAFGLLLAPIAWVGYYLAAKDD